MLIDFVLNISLTISGIYLFHRVHFIEERRMLDSDIFQTLLMTTLAVLLLWVPIDVSGVELSVFFVPLLLLKSRLSLKFGAVLVVYMFYHFILGLPWQIYLVFAVLYFAVMLILPFIKGKRTYLMPVLNLAFASAVLITVHALIHDITITQAGLFLIMSTTVMLIAHMMYEDISTITRLVKRYEETTYKDHLTQLGNVRALDYFVDELDETSETLSILLIDIDNFKVINDEHDYKAGDALIKQMTHLLKNYAPTGGELFRNSGEEFSMIIPNLTLDKTVRLAEAIRISVEKSNFHISEDDNTTVKLTVSIGVGYKGADKTKGRLFKDADDMLHAAKKMGQNQVMFLPVLPEINKTPEL